MARHNRMSSLQLTTTSTVEEDTVTSNEGWIFKLETTEVVVIGADENARHFEMIVHEEVTKASYPLVKFKVDLTSMPKISDDEDRFWIARNIHYSVWATMSGALDDLALDEWINVKELKRLAVKAAEDLPKAPDYDGMELPIPVKWLEK